MICIGENINIVSKTLGPAIKNMEKGPIQELAIKEKEAGMDYLDVNLGPARKQGSELMEWLVKTVQEVADLPFLLDTTNIEAIEAGLKVHKGKAIINSISCKPERMDVLFPLVKKYNAGFVGLLLGPEGIPRDGTERGALAAELLSKMADAGIPEEDVWIDPIVLPVSSQQNQVQGCTEFMKMFRELAPNSKSTCGISNVSNGTAEKLRPILNRVYLVMLEKYGMGSAILDAFDKEIVGLVKGEKEDLKQVVWKVMEGENLDAEKLSSEQVDYLKTTNVLLGQSLYSDSWLKL